MSDGENNRIIDNFRLLVLLVIAKNLRGYSQCYFVYKSALIHAVTDSKLTTLKVQCVIPAGTRQNVTLKRAGGATEVLSDDNPFSYDNPEQHV